MLGLNHTPSDGTAAVSKDYTESRYVVKDANIDMDNKCILNLPFPLTLDEPITRGFVERYYGTDYVNILTFKRKPGSVTVIHAGDSVDLVNGKPDVDFSKVGSSYQINFSVRPKLPTGIYTYEMDVVLATSRGYNITLWGDCGGSGYTASTKYKYWSWSYENTIQQNDAQCGYFHRGTGKRVGIKGSFLNRRNRTYGQEISYSLDSENGKTYEFVMQELKTTQSDILGNTIYFLFEPDNNKSIFRLKGY